MDPTAKRLLEEVERWRERLDAQLGEAEPATEQGRRFLENIQAYRSDTDHFEAEGDPVRAFEAIVWAWAWLEIGAETGDVDWSYPEDGFDEDGFDEGGFDPEA